MGIETVAGRSAIQIGESNIWSSLIEVETVAGCFDLVLDADGNVNFTQRRE